MNRLLKKYLLLGLTALQTATLTALLAACSDELPGDDNNGLPKGWSRIELVLSAEPDLSTRAWDDKFATDKEMMKSAIVIMAKKNNEGKNIVERIIPVTMEDTWYERQNVATIATENGNYTFYSFGNIDYKKPEGYTNGDLDETTLTVPGITFKKGFDLPDGLETSTWKAVYNNYSPSASSLIPMTNKEEHPVNSTRTITLRLFRMLAKINFEFTNNTGEDIRIQKITLHQLTPNGTPVYLLPPKDGQNIVNRFPATFTNNSVKFVDEKATPSQAFDVPKAEAGTDPTPVSKSFYLNESLSTHATGQMPLTILMTRKGKTSEERFSLMRLSGIPRNSNVFVPITLTDYVMKLKAFAYAPIGGYPPYTLTESENEFYCTFSTGGDFALRPSMYKYEDEKKPENWFELTDKSKVQDFTITYHDPDNIFTTTPHFEGGEIVGTLKTPKPEELPFKGTASVDLKVMLKTGTDGSVLQEYNRTLYIILNQK